MALYYCHNCQEMIDGDYNPMVEHPFGKQLPSYKGETCCDECSVVLEYEMEEALEEDRHE